ncbi:unnamed protein product, partial [Rotaria sp. Silwood2]
VIYDEIYQHYLSHQHQQCLIWFIKKLFPKASQRQAKSVLQPFIDEQYTHMLTASIERIDLIAQDIEPIIQNCANLTSERQKHETKIAEIRAQSVKIKESSDKNAKITENCYQQFVDMDKLLDGINLKSITGPWLLSSDNTYTYKFNLHSLINNGQTVQSEPVHTSQSGYKLALIYGVFLDEKSQKRYLSISFIILPGEFDAILSWPFRFPITISILNLKETKKNINHSIPWNFQTVAFNKLINNTNVPFQISQFCLVDTLLDNTNTYVQDGLIFVKIHIDFMEPSANPTPNKEGLRTIQDPIQTNILQNMLTN